MNYSSEGFESNLQPLGKRKGESQPLLPRRKVVDDSQGCEPDVGQRKVPRTQLDYKSIKVDGKNCGRQVWLVKLPPSVYRAWDEINEGDILGQLVVKRNEKNDEILDVEMNGLSTTISNGKKVSLPNCTLKCSRQVSDSLVFSQSEVGKIKGGGAKIEAAVVRAYTMQPNPGSTYRNLMQNRMIAATVKQQYVKPTEMPMKKLSNANQKHIFNIDFEKDKMRKIELLTGESRSQDLNYGKKLKLDKGTLRGKLFDLFNQQERWMLKELSSVLNQPEDHIKAVLKDIGEMHRTGIYRNNYELKAEYRTNVDFQKPSGGSSSL